MTRPAALLLAAFAASAAHAHDRDLPLVTGDTIVSPPLGTTADVGSLPMAMIASPDGRHAVVSNMGFRQFLTAIEVKTGRVTSRLDFANVPPRAETWGLYYGLAWGTDGKLYAAQGGNDSIAVVTLDGAGQLELDGVIDTPRKFDFARFQPGDFPAGLAADGRGYLYVANNSTTLPVDASFRPQSGSLSVYDVSQRREVGRLAFDRGVPFVNFPLAVAALADGSKAYVSSQRDGAVYVVDTHLPTSPSLLARLDTGLHPDALLLDRAGKRLFVANAHSDTVSVVDTATDAIAATILVRPGGPDALVGATPTGLALSADERFLLVTLGDADAVAVVDLSAGKVRGYLPVGWYPTAAVLSKDGKRLLVANAKGTSVRNPNADGRYILDLIEGNVQGIPLHRGLARAELLEDRDLLALRDRGGDRDDEVEGEDCGPGRPALGGRIQHVVYVIKENRTYDQVLGDVPQGNGDPSLALFGRNVTPNTHALVRRFALLDDFYVVGEASGDGWPWSTTGQASEYVIKNLPYNYSGRGRLYDFEGQNNGLLSGGHPGKDVDGRPLSALFVQGAPAFSDVSVTPGGHVWDAVQKAGLTYRNYGFHLSTGFAPLIPDNYPASAGVRPEGHDLAGVSDYDFRRFDTDYPDSDAPALWNARSGAASCLYRTTRYGKAGSPSRFAEWLREFQLMLAHDPTGAGVPAFMTVRFMTDHTAGLSAGAHSPRSMVADNDYAVGQLVEALSKSPIWKSTAVFVVEDDAQDGADHVDAHRSPVLVASPWVRRGTVDSRFYNTISVLRTMKELLGVPFGNAYEASAPSMLRLFGRGPTNAAPYQAILPAKELVCEVNPGLLALGDPLNALVVASASLDFTHADGADPKLLNEIIWKSVKGPASTPPAPRTRFVRPGKAVADLDD